MHSARLLATYSTVYEIYSARERCGRVFLVWPLTLSVVVNVGKYRERLVFSPLLAIWSESHHIHTWAKIIKIGVFCLVVSPSSASIMIPKLSSKKYGERVARSDYSMRASWNGEVCRARWGKKWFGFRSVPVLFFMGVPTYWYPA